MKERALTVSGPEARAIRSGAQTQFLRPIHRRVSLVGGLAMDMLLATKCPYPIGAPLWLRETWADADCMYQCHANDSPGVVAYRADMTALQFDAMAPRAIPPADLQTWNFDALKWRSPRTMPRWASRIDLAVTDGRGCRLSDITEADALAEGLQGDETLRPVGWDPNGDDWNAGATANYIASFGDPATPIGHFRHLWETIYGAGSWALNPWVWVCGFRVVRGGL